MLEAFKQYAEYSTGEDWILSYTVPMSDEQDMVYLSEYLAAYSAGSIRSNPAGIGNRFETYMHAFEPYIKRIGIGTTNISDQLGFSTGTTLRATLADMALDLSQVKTNLQENLRFSYQTDASGNHLLVRDEDLRTVLGYLVQDFSTFMGSFGMYAEKMDYYWDNSEDSSSALASDLSEQLTDIRQAQQGQIDYLDEDVSSEESDYRTDAQDDYDDEEEAATEYFEDISLPSASDSYAPSISDPSIDESDLGIENDDSVYHNALLRLVTARRDASNIVPEIEVDFGRMSSLVNGLGQFASWIEWLAGALFALLLSAKGLAMWRVVRTASVSAQCGEAPIVHLAYNPF